VQAARTVDPETRATPLIVAEQYDRMAALAEEKPI
jgi:hypothetical protein